MYSKNDPLPTKGDLATVTVECLTCQEQRPMLSPEYRFTL